jgi:hypothetical protein
LEFVDGAQDGLVQLVGSLTALDAVDHVVGEPDLPAHADVVIPLVRRAVHVRHPEYSELAQARRQRR